MRLGFVRHYTKFRTLSQAEDYEYDGDLPQGSADRLTVPPRAVAPGRRRGLP